MPLSAWPCAPSLPNLILGSILAPGLALALVVPPAVARERPGTPSHSAMSLVGPATLRMTWINTRRVGQGDNGFTEQTFFDVEGQTDPSRPEFGVNPIMKQEVTFDITGLGPGRHCFRAWSRESPNGVRSDVPSAWACGTIPGPQRPPRTGPNPGIGTVLSGQRATVWVAAPLYYGTQARQPSSVDEGQFDDTGQTPQDAGVFLVATAAADCAYPWRRVVYQYGGWPNLGPAGFTTRTAPYGLCWYPHVPTAAESVVPSPPPVRLPIGGGGSCTPGRNCP